jgi:NAD(P)-dependent dehydrogenase (short-subunit alcohol dehydrogenase family)
MTGSRVAGKKAFVSGAAQGLGAAMARRLAEEGAKVSLGDINFAGAQEVAASINVAQGEGTAFAFPLDVTREDQWIATLGQADAAMGGLSVLINNAGILVSGDIEQLPYEDWKKAMTVNVDSVFLGTKHGLPYLRNNQPGSIINISSIAGLIASHNMPSYNGSKAAVWMLTKSIALHCARQKLDVRCNSIHPTFVDTPILDDFRAQFGKESAEAKLGRQIPLGRIAEPADVANAALYLASDESRFVTAAELKIDGGISAQ